MRVREYHAAWRVVKGWLGLPMHHFGAADLNGLGSVLRARGYAGLSGLKKRLVGPFPWLGEALWAGWQCWGGRGCWHDAFFHCAKPQCWTGIQHALVYGLAYEETGLALASTGSDLMAKRMA